MLLGFEEDGFFTRDDFRDYIETPLTEMFEGDFGISAYFRCYLADDDRTIETDCSFDGNQFTVKTLIDFRSIKKPSDLEKYSYKIYRQIIEDYGDYLGFDY